MYENLDLMRTSAALARHAGAQQAVVAGNIANADTPGFRARSLPAFAAELARAAPLRQTRPGHVSIGPSGSPTAVQTNAEPSPDGNSVSIEREMLASVEAQREHSRALSIWRHTMSVIRTSLGR